MWTDGQEMIEGCSLERFACDMPLVNRNDAWWDTHSHRNHLMYKLTHEGQVYAKVFCGDLGYYRVVPTYP